MGLRWVAVKRYFRNELTSHTKYHKSHNMETKRLAVFKSKIVSKKCTVSIFRCVVPVGLSLESKGSPKK